MLNVTVREETVNETVECVHQNVENELNTVGQKVLIECMHMLSVCNTMY